MKRLFCPLVLYCLLAGAAVAAASQAAVDDVRVWVERTAQSEDEKLMLRVAHAEYYEGQAPLFLDCAIEGADPQLHVLARFVLFDSDGCRAHEGQLHLILKEDRTPFRFELDPGSVPSGVYLGHLEVVRPAERVVAWQEFCVEKIVGSELAAALDAAAKRAVELRHAVGSLAASPSPYTAVRLAIAEDFINAAQRDFDDDDWRRARATIEYLGDVLDFAASQLAPEPDAPELAGMAPREDLGTIGIRNGTFYLAGRPVFLFGVYGDDNLADELSMLRRYGLNFAVFEMAPIDTLAPDFGKKDLAAKFDPLVARAQEANIALSVSLAPHRMCDWAFEKWPEMRTADCGLMNFDLTHVGARSVLENHFRMAAAYLAEQPAVTSVCLVDAPRFRLEGEPVRNRFVRHAQDLYANRYALNTSWKTRLRDFDEVGIWWDHGRPAYQYDWQTFHEGLASEWFAWTASLVHEAAPNMPRYAKLADDAFETGASRGGVNREGLASLMQISGCSARISNQSSRYSVGYPQQNAHFALLQSLAPDNPVLNTETHVDLAGSRGAGRVYATVYSMIWEGVMSGLDGLAVPSSESGEGAAFWRNPEAVDALAMACLDLNRLGDVVAACQRAPIDLGILWSMSAKIFHDGDPYLASAYRAYEGCSFSGYNVGFVSERQCLEGKLDDVRVLVLPKTPAMEERPFQAIKAATEAGAPLIRTGEPSLYDQRGYPRKGVIVPTENTVLIRGNDTPGDYLDAVDAMAGLGNLPAIPRAVNPHGYPLEGIRTRYLDLADAEYLYVLNLRKAPVMCALTGGARSGRDLIRRRDVAFPRQLDPLDPMLVRLAPLDERPPEADAPTTGPSRAGEGAIPTAEVRAVSNPAGQAGTTARVHKAK
ncbi:MAG TPA: hypothetical protein HPP83_04705 [Candidatus Hydrogenedentes bacterium]|nr:hypothetical protein [Candidatus Hydrogenedentota bacterium]